MSTAPLISPPALGPSHSSGMDRRRVRREAGHLARRRYPRFRLDLEWIVESSIDGAWGKGLEMSLRGIRLPIPLCQRLRGPLMLRLSLPGTSKMFCANLVRVSTQRGTAFRFVGLSAEALRQLADVLIDAYGPSVIPALEREIDRRRGVV